MRCAYSSEFLALYVAGDLPGSSSDNVKRHLVGCPECQEFCTSLEENRSILKSLRQETASERDVAAVHRRTMSGIENLRPKLGWMKIERFLVMGLRRPRYVVAGALLLAVLSVSLLGAMRQSVNATGAAAATFEGNDTLLRPANYREWVFVGSSIGLNYAAATASAGRQGPQLFHNVYIDPVAYRHYEKTREFPEGTVMILELASAELKSEPGLQGSYEKEFVALEASVKDSRRFKGGWAYFGFTDGSGKLKPKAQPFPETAGCLACHQEHAETDHVFTQFYPVLRAARS